PPPGFYRLLIGRVPTHTFGRTTNNRVLGELTPENEVWVNAVTAKDHGLQHGRRTRLVNQDGVTSDPVLVKVTQRIRPDAVFLPHGFGRFNDKLRFASGKGTRDTIMGGTSTNTNFVTFSANGAAAGATTAQEA
ncbi:MAG: nitrate reductase, partial [Gammaproteobacteria bacterium]|nr:nitrate reductase [Gammaproteobacteria bacterium]